jgi:hypothetical protein
MCATPPGAAIGAGGGIGAAAACCAITICGTITKPSSSAMVLPPPAPPNGPPASGPATVSGVPGEASPAPAPLPPHTSAASNWRRRSGCSLRAGCAHRGWGVRLAYARRSVLEGQQTVHSTRSCPPSQQGRTMTAASAPSG